MKINFKKIAPFLLTGLCTVIIVFSCTKEDLINPAEAFFGKWEIAYVGDVTLTPIENPNTYTEYLPDSIYRVYIYDEERFNYEKYWINDSILFKTYTFIASVENDTTIFIERFKFFFLEDGDLRLDNIDPVTTSTGIYKRID